MSSIFNLSSFHVVAHQGELFCTCGGNGISCVGVGFSGQVEKAPSAACCGNGACAISLFICFTSQRWRCVCTYSHLWDTRFCSFCFLCFPQREKQEFLLHSCMWVSVRITFGYAGGLKIQACLFSWVFPEKWNE